MVTEQNSVMVEHEVIRGWNTCQNLKENGRHLMAVAPLTPDRQFTNFKLNHVRNNHLYQLMQCCY